MAETIGRMKSWAWWLAGAACALVFGLFRTSAQAQSGDVAMPMYGIIPQKPPSTDPVVTPETRKKADALIGRYLDPAVDAKAQPEVREQIAAAIERLDSDKAEVVQDAKKSLIAFGPAGLTAVREKASGKTSGAAQAGEVAAQIQLVARQAVVGELKGLGSPATMLVHARMRAEGAAGAEAAARQAEALKKGDEDAAAKALAEAKLARQRRQVLNRLIRDLMAPPGGPAVPQARYGVRCAP